MRFLCEKYADFIGFRSCCWIKVLQAVVNNLFIFFVFPIYHLMLSQAMIIDESLHTVDENKPILREEWLNNMINLLIRYPVHVNVNIAPFSEPLLVWATPSVLPKRFACEIYVHWNLVNLYPFGRWLLLRFVLVASTFEFQLLKDLYSTYDVFSDVKCPLSKILCFTSISLWSLQASKTAVKSMNWPLTSTSSLDCLGSISITHPSKTGHKVRVTLDQAKHNSFHTTEHGIRPATAKFSNQPVSSQLLEAFFIRLPNDRKPLVNINPALAVYLVCFEPPFSIGTPKGLSRNLRFGVCDPSPLYIPSFINWHQLKTLKLMYSRKPLSTALRTVNSKWFIVVCWPLVVSMMNADDWKADKIETIRCGRHKFMFAFFRPHDLSPTKTDFISFSLQIIYPMLYLY